MWEWDWGVIGRWVAGLVLVLGLTKVCLEHITLWRENARLKREAASEAAKHASRIHRATPEETEKYASSPVRPEVGPRQPPTSTLTGTTVLLLVIIAAALWLVFGSWPARP